MKFVYVAGLSVLLFAGACSDSDGSADEGNRGPADAGGGGDDASTGRATDPEPSADAGKGDAGSGGGAGADAGQDPDAGSAQSGPLGFAGAAGVTGGRGGRSVVVTSLEDSGPGSLRAALAESEGPRVITFAPGLTGTINLRSVAYVNSDDVTVDGTGAHITISGYSINVFKTDESAVRNIEIHNLTFDRTLTERNALIVDHGSHDVWIDHCTFRRNSDGETGQGLSLRNQDPGRGGNTGVTVSWNHFTTPNKKSILIGSADTEVEGRVMRISMHHNWFDGVDARNPRISFATVHMWNNYLSNWVEYGVAAAIESHLLAENNIFEANSRAGVLDSYANTDASSVAASGNLLLGTPTPVVRTRGTFPMDRIVYSVTPAPADEALKQAIIAGAGAH